MLRLPDRSQEVSGHNPDACCSLLESCDWDVEVGCAASRHNACAGFCSVRPALPLPCHFASPLQAFLYVRPCGFKLTRTGTSCISVF